MTDQNTSSSSMTLFMQSIASSDIEAMNDTARDLVMTLLATGTDTGKPLLDRIANLLSPEMMFNKSTAPYPLLWAELRKFLAERNVALRVHQRHRAVYTVANTIYVDEDENQTAIALAKRIINGTIYNEGPNAIATHTAVHSDTSGHVKSFKESDHREKTAHNVAMRLKDTEQKFSGDLAQCWQDYRDQYEQIAEDYNLTNDQRFQLMHNVLCKDAHRFFLDTIKPIAKDYSEAFVLLEQEYNSVVRQTRFKNHLSGLRIEYFVKDDVDNAAALAKVYKRILAMSRQVPQSHRGDPHKIEFLRKAVIGHTWARGPLGRIATAGLTFQQLYAELEIAVQLERESVAAAAKTSLVQLSGSNDVEKVHFMGQGKFARGKQSARNLRTERKRTCFNCGSESHLVKQCPHPVNFSRAAANRVRQLRGTHTRHAVHIVLAHLCSELDEPISEQETEGDVETDDAAIFEAMLVTDVQQSVLEPDHDGGDTELEKIDIFSVQVNFEPTTNEFWGACIDSGAQRTVIGQKESEANVLQVGTDTDVRRNQHCSQKRFRFGEVNHHCLGTLKLRMPVAHDIVVTFEAYIVPLDIPLLLGLDVLRQLKLIVNFDDGSLISLKESWSMQLVHKLGHLYVEWLPSVYYTEAELRRIHRHFYHPSTDKLLQLIRQGASKHITSELRGQLVHIRDTCDTCQRLASSPNRFRVSMPKKDCVFDRTVGMDIMKIEKQSLLHVVDKDNKFSAAAFLRGETSEKVWEAFLMCWVATYIGFPDKVVLDQGNQFQSTEFRSLLQAAGIKHIDAGVESHNAPGETERYHAYLRNLFERVRLEYPDLAVEVVLQLSIKACDDTAGPAGMVPALLVFGVVPRMPVHPSDLPRKRERMMAMHDACKHMAKLTAQERLQKAVNSRVTRSTDVDIEIGDQVLVFRDEHGRWDGPYRVIDVKRKVVHISHDGRTVQFSIDRCKPYRVSEEVQDLLHDSKNAADVALREDADRHRGKQQETGFWELNDYTNDTPSIFVVRIFGSSNPRSRQQDFVAAKKREVEGLKFRNIWTKVNENTVSPNANIVGGRFIMTLKIFQTPEESAKVRYIAQGFADIDKPFMVHEVTALRPTSIRLILSLAAICGLRLFSHDVNQAYLQSREPFSREVYLRPKAEDRHLFGVSAHEILKLKKPLYGLCDSGDYWNATIDNHLINQLKMKRAVSDLSLYYKFNDGKLGGITGNYVDNNLNAGDEMFQKDAELTLTTFESKPRVYDNFNFFGNRIITKKPNLYNLSQEHYIRSLQKLPVDLDFPTFRRARALLAWVIHSRPEFACVINKSAQVTEERLSKKHICDYNRAVREARSTQKLGLNYGPLEVKTLHLRVYTDASFASNDDMSSQLAYLILLCDCPGNFHVLEFSSKKSKRVVRSIMGGELYAFPDAFDASLILATDLSRMLGKKVPVRMFTDSKQVFDVITHGKRPTEKRIAIVVTSAREAYHRFEIDQVGLVRGECNPADALSKLKHNGVLGRLLTTGVDDTPIEEWIVRTEGNDSPVQASIGSRSNDEKSGKCYNSGMINSP